MRKFFKWFDDLESDEQFLFMFVGGGCGFGLALFASCFM